MPNIEFLKFFSSINTPLISVTIILYLTFLYKASDLEKKRDNCINKLLESLFIKITKPTFTDIRNIILKEFPNPKIRILFSSVEPTGFKKALFLFIGSGIASMLLFIIKVKWVQLIIPLPTIYGLFYFIDDIRFYIQLLRIEKLSDN